MKETTKTKTVLLLEQDPDLLHFWKEALEQEGLLTVSARSFQEAILQVESDLPDLVFLGTGFEGEDGMQLLAKIHERNHDVKVVSPKDQAQVKEELQAMKEQGGLQGKTKMQVDEVKVAIRGALQTSGVLPIALLKELAERLIGESDVIQKLREQILYAAESGDTIVLLRGETGTGKGLAARSIHELSTRKASRFVEVNCTAIPETLLESELFGHEAGAFTDAKTSKQGLFEVADGGTLFLDEIGDMGGTVQAKLLQVLENKRIRRIGATSEKGVDVRVIAATHQDLEVAVKERKFREDLYFRLNVFPILLPPLRGFLTDVVLLARNFIQEFNREFHKEITGLTFTAEKKLREYSYPGNVRELRNIIERAVILEKGRLLSGENIAIGIPQPDTQKGDRALPEDLDLSAMEKRMVEEALRRAGGNQSEAAELLKITRFALRNRMKKFSLL